MHKYAIIVAGGNGTRMQSELPKQFLELAGKPILMHTINAFYFDEIEIILVLPADQIAFWNSLCTQYRFSVPHTIVSGGATRFNSVKNALDSIIDESGVVAIHDGVRPIIKRETISNSYKVAENSGNAIVSVACKDSLRKVSGKGNSAVNREDYQLIQTPQTFQIKSIKSAFNADYQSSFTDDASVFEHHGETINLITGDYRNIKITTPEDLLVAESFLK